jgi:2-polyprenyl-6-methoxyphenol hydroxylase-like FAD-dependent oxidoreductase
MSAKQGCAVVLGASISGLLAGRVLADFFDEVILLDKEGLDQGPVPRRAVPQGNHIHVILAPTYHVLNRFLPDLIEDLVAGGAHVFDAGTDLQFHVHGNFLARGQTGQKLIGSTRPFFEDRLRRRVKRIDNVEIRTCHRFVGWVASEDRRRIEGVTVEYGGREAAMRADLVVDARGLSSVLPKELEALGYDAPGREIVGVDLEYTSRLYSASGFSPGWNLLIVNPSPPKSTMGALIEQVEDDRWIVTQFAYFGDHAPTDDAGFLERARSLAVPDIAEFLAVADPVSDFQRFGTRQCTMRRFDELEKFPDRLIAVGDAVCNLNPIYGQGMTKAARESARLWDALASHLECSDSMDGFSDAFRRSLPGAGAKWAWQLTSGNDLAYPQTRGTRRPEGAFMRWYMRRLFIRSAQSLDARKRLLDVLMLVEPPTHLIKPRMLLHAVGL